MPLLYRGVPLCTRRGRQALNGIVEPRGTSTNYESHVLGADAATDVTSWTRDRAVAEKFDDIILLIEEDDVRDRIVPHPLPGANRHEHEVLIRGRLTNVKSAK